MTTLNYTCKCSSHATDCVSAALCELRFQSAGGLCQTKLDKLQTHPVVSGTNIGRYYSTSPTHIRHRPGEICSWTDAIQKCLSLRKLDFSSIWLGLLVAVLNDEVNLSVWLLHSVSMSSPVIYGCAKINLAQCMKHPLARSLAAYAIVIGLEV